MRPEGPVPRKTEIAKPVPHPSRDRDGQRPLSRAPDQVWGMGKDLG
jgi:hypothetical protein